MKYTGERFLPEIKGNIYLEHIHRYLFAKNFTENKIVVDIACGEGFGSVILAENADQVFGVDISPEAVEHATKKYSRDNLQFRVGSCEKIPIQNQSVDIVVSFETIEHHQLHTEMFSEIKRILKPDGILIISSPDKENYSIIPGYQNPFHVKELYVREFKELIGENFKYSLLGGQRIKYGSLICAEGTPTRFSSYENDIASIQKTEGVFVPLYNIAICSDEILPVFDSSIYEQSIDESETVLAWQDEVKKRDNLLQSIESLLAHANQVRESQLSDLQLRNLIGSVDEISLEANQNENATHVLDADIHRNIQYLINDFSDSFETIKTQFDHAQTEINHYQAEISRCQAAISDYQSELSNKDITLQNLLGRNQLQESQIRDLSYEVTCLQHEVVRYELSRSWIITRPLRKLLKLLSGRTND